MKFAVRGGIEVSATISYYLQPNFCTQGLSGARCSVKTCLRLYDGNPNNHVDINPWYQTRTIKKWKIRCSVVHPSMDFIWIS